MPDAHHPRCAGSADLGQDHRGAPEGREASLTAMLDAIGLQVPEAAAELRRLNATVKVMHSFVHGGAHLVVHALRGYPAEKLAAVLLNRNLLSLMLANVIVVASQSPRLTGAVRRLMAAHSFCMPPEAAS